VTDPELTDIQKVEQQHGFTFGNDGANETAKAEPLITVVCNNPVCDHLNQHVQMFADVEQPVHCGGCFSVLFCDHVAGDPIVRIGGTFGAPVQTTQTSCVKCGLIMSDVKVDLPPIKLKDMPVTGLSSLPTAP
jgi:hypothetical protein